MPEATALDIVDSVFDPTEVLPASVDDVRRLPPFAEKIAACEQLCGTPFSAVDDAVQQALVLRRLQQMTSTLMINPAWKERLHGAGVREAPRDVDEWQRVPLSDKRTIRELFMGARSGLVVPLTDGGFEIVASGGTSDGLPVETVYSLRELHDTYRIAGRFIGEHVLREHLAGPDPKWLVTTLADYQMWSSGTMVGGVLQHVPGVNYIGAGPVSKEVYQHVLSYPGPKAIMAISRGIAVLTDLGAGATEAARASLRVALYGSGLLAHRKQRELQECYPNLAIMSYFAATEAEAIGLQRMPDSFLTAVPGLHLIEIVDEAGRWVAEGEEGELVVTRLHAREAPLPRFKVGDRMIRRPRLNTPALKADQFEFRGRSGDVIHLCDTQYAARPAYEALCHALQRSGVCDLAALAREAQFTNDRRAKVLSLVAAVDWADSLTSRAEHVLGPAGIRGVFVEALIQALSLFNRGEANAQAIDKTGYAFELRFVDPWSEAIHRTPLGKVPLIRDRF